MCAICHSAPCHPRCPNAPEPIAVDDCYVCDKPIREGEEYYSFCGVAICTECLEKMSVSKLADIYGANAGEIIVELGGEEKVGEVD